MALHSQKLPGSSYKFVFLCFHLDSCIFWVWLFLLFSFGICIYMIYVSIACMLDRVLVCYLCIHWRIERLPLHIFSKLKNFDAVWDNKNVYISGDSKTRNHMRKAVELSCMKGIILQTLQTLHEKQGAFQRQKGSSELWLLVKLTGSGVCVQSRQLFRYVRHVGYIYIHDGRAMACCFCLSSKLKEFSLTGEEFHSRAYWWASRGQDELFPSCKCLAREEGECFWWYNSFS